MRTYTGPSKESVDVDVGKDRVCIKAATRPTVSSNSSSPPPGGGGTSVQGTAGDLTTSPPASKRWHLSVPETIVLLASQACWFVRTHFCRPDQDATSSPPITLRAWEISALARLRITALHKQRRAVCPSSPSACLLCPILPSAGGLSPGTPYVQTRKACT